MDMQTVAVQLYSAREALTKDFEGTIRRLADFGYRAVETANIYGESPQAARTLFDDLGITVAAAHIGFPIAENASDVIDTMGTIGCDTVICPWLDPQTYYQDMDGIKRACEMLNESYAKLQPAGLKLAYHNHDFEIATIDGKPALLHMHELLDDGIAFEVDTYWVQVGGLDPAAFVVQLGERASLLHLKDGPANREAAMTALGAGVIDVPAILEKSSAQWHIVELDRCDTDMMTALQESYAYLKGLD